MIGLVCDIRDAADLALGKWRRAWSRPSGRGGGAGAAASPAGFSIIELVLVMAIVAVLASMAIPRYGRAIASYRVSAAAQRIVADIALAQATARAASKTQTIEFTPGVGGGYTLVGVRDLNSGAPDYHVVLDAEPYLTRITQVDSPNAASKTGGVTLAFNGYGVGDAPVTLTLASNGQQKSITFDPTTGRCTIQ